MLEIHHFYAHLGPLLCELHAHSLWSDGDLAIAELVDLHGRNGFDVLCLTDHVVRTNDSWLGEDGARSVNEAVWPADLADVEREAARAWRTYGLLVLPGLELTFSDEEPVKAAHALALGLREFVSVDHGIAEAMRTAAQAGAAIVAAHPFRAASARAPTARLTRRFSCDPALCELAHRFELFNREQLFGWVAEARLPAVASGDFHRPEHLGGWKTLLPSVHDEEAVVAYLRSHRPVYLTRLDAERGELAA